MSTEVTLEALLSSVPNGFKVDKETCIGCQACSDTYPDGFGFDHEASVAFETDPTAPGKYKPDEVIQICPSDSIFIPGYAKGNPEAQGGQWPGNTATPELEEDDDDSPFERILRPSMAEQEPAEFLTEPRITDIKQKVLVALAMPLLGALPPRLRLDIEEAIQDEAFYTADAAAAFNMTANFFIYSIGFFVLNLLSGASIYSDGMKGAVFTGFALAAVEALIRFLCGPWIYKGDEQSYVLGAPYAIPVGILYEVKRSFAKRPVHLRRSPFTIQYHDGRHVEGVRPMNNLEAERDRRRRYGNVYHVENQADHVGIALEFPHWVPAHRMVDGLDVGNAMPHYEWSVEVDGNVVAIIGRVPHGALHGLTGKVHSFPPSFRKNFICEDAIEDVESRYDETARTLHVTARKVAGSSLQDEFEGLSDAVQRVA